MHHPHSHRRFSVRATAFAPAAVVLATAAAMTLAACGPRDETPTAGGPSSPVATAPVATAPVATAIAPTPVDAPATTTATTPQAAPTAAPSATYAAPAPVYPADPAPQERAQPTPVPATPVRAVASNRVGEITSIEPIRTRPQGSGAGAVVGGVLGAVVGNQFGHGLGRAALTGAGAVGGALAGNNVERNHKEGISGYRVVVRLENGHTRVFDRTDVGNLHVGDRVRLDADSFHRA